MINTAYTWSKSSLLFSIISIMASLSLIQMILQNILLGTDSNVTPRLSLEVWQWDLSTIQQVTLHWPILCWIVHTVYQILVLDLLLTFLLGDLLFFRLFIALMISSLVGGSRFVSNVSSVSRISSSMSRKVEGIGLLRTSLKCSAHLSSCFLSKVIFFHFYL